MSHVMNEKKYKTFIPTDILCSLICKMFNIRPIITILFSRLNISHCVIL